MITTFLSSVPRVSEALSYAVRVEARTLRHEARSKPGDFWPAVVLHAAAGGFFWLSLWFSLHTTKRGLGDGDPELFLALASVSLATYAFLWFCIAGGGGGEIVPISRLEKLAQLRWTPGQAYAAGVVMAAFKPLPLFFSLSFLTIGLMLFPPAGAASVLASCLATGVTALGIVALTQGARCAIELASWRGALRTLARVLAGGLFLAITLLLAWFMVGGDWIERIGAIPGSWIEMAPTSLLARAYHLAGEGRLAELPGVLALLGAFSAAGFLFGWRLTRRRVFLAGGSRPAPAGPRDRIPGLAAWLGWVLPPPYPTLVAREVLAALRWKQLWIQAAMPAMFACVPALNPALALAAGEERASIPYFWLMPGLAIALLAIFQTGSATNLFSRDGRAACEYLLLPLDERQILGSKNIAFAVIQYAVTAFCTPLLLFAFWFHDLLGPGLQALGAVVLAPVAMVIACNYLSILSPARPASRKDPRLHAPGRSRLLHALVASLLLAAGVLYFSIDSGPLRHAAAAFGVLAAAGLPAGYVLALRHQTRLLRQRRLAVAEVFS